MMYQLTLSLFVFISILSCTSGHAFNPFDIIGDIFNSGSGEKCEHDIHHILHCQNSPNTTKTTGISQGLFDQMQLFAQYSAAAYCLDNSNSPGNVINCTKSHNCPLVEAANAKSAEEFDDKKPYDDHGYIAVDNVHKVVVLAFRGAQSAPNWIQNMNFDHAPSDLCDDCEVHDGFWEMWKGVRNKLFEDVDQALGKNPGYRFVVTGHSLGGALATLAAASFRKRDKHFAEFTELFSYAAPRVGTGATADFLTTQSNKSYRITSGHDYVPRLPAATFGYMHMSPEYWIERYGVNPRPEDIDILTGAFNNKGNSGSRIWQFSKKSHRQYFMDNISGCGS